MWGPIQEGELTLSEDRLTLTGPDGVIFSVPVGEVTSRFPRLYLGLGMKLRVNQEWYRPWFLRSLAAASGVSSRHDVSEFENSDIGPARETGREWRMALSGEER